MRKLVLSMMVSLDALTARRDGDLGWFLTDERFEQIMLSRLRSVDAMLFGRVSYQLLADYWPTAGRPGGDDAPGGFTSQERAQEFTRLMNSVPKVVFSTTLSQPSWGPVRVIREDVAGEVTKMKDQPGRP